MSKDPAFLFYPGDWLGGTITFTRAQKGAYVDLLVAQFNQKSLSFADIKQILGTDFWMWETKLCSKFEKDENGLYFNHRLREEMIRRKLYTDSRKDNLAGSPHMAPHMENENINEDINKTVVKGRFDFEILWFIYPKKLGKKEAERHFYASVKTDQDFTEIKTALNNFKSSRVAKGDPQFIPHGATFFNNWRDWVVMPETEKFCEYCKNKGIFTSSTGYETICKCPAGKGKSLK